MTQRVPRSNIKLTAIERGMAEEINISCYTYLQVYATPIIYDTHNITPLKQPPHPRGTKIVVDKWSVLSFLKEKNVPLEMMAQCYYYSLMFF